VLRNVQPRREADGTEQPGTKHCERCDANAEGIGPPLSDRGTMCKRFSIFCLLAIGLMAGPALAQSSSDSQIVPLCGLQTKLAQGEHRHIQVEGVYLSGLEGQYLVTSDCSGRSTWVEFELRTHRLWKQLVRLSNRTDREKHVSGTGDPVLVVFEGEFYGPQVPDPKLPEAFRRNYHPGWDPMNASMTKMVVRAIQRVKPLPADHPCASPKSDPKQWPCFQNSAPQSGGVALGR
jgi:hypothetical protein